MSTARRLNKVRAVLARRQPDLTVLLDRVEKPHNLSAIARTCDAVGIMTVHAVTTAKPGDKPGGLRHHTSAGSRRWVNIVNHRDIADPVQQFRGRHMQILAAHLSESAIDYRDADYTRPTALLLGEELDGLSDEAVQVADQHIRVPMLGMVESLNVSVAAALILYEAQRQRAAAGLFDRPGLDPDTIKKTEFEWLHPKIAAYCRANDQPYPELDEDGDIIPEGQA